MERRILGNTSLEVSAIALGCQPLGGDFTHERAFELLNLSRELGITFFDNGAACGTGRAESVLGRWMKEHNIPRDHVEIGSKFGDDFGSDREPKQDFSPMFMRDALEQSLVRLGVETIDLYMAQNITLPQFRDDLWAELEKVKEEGKIRVWGVSPGPAIGWREEGTLAMLEHGAKAVQTVFNMFEQHPGRELCETAIATHGGVFARMHDYGGILKDIAKVDKGDPAWKVYGLKKVELVRHYATDHGMNVHELACKWLLQQPGLTAITATLLNEKEIREAANACDKPKLSMKELTEISENYARDWGLGPDAHPCDIESSVHPSGRVRSGYVPSPVLIA